MSISIDEIQYRWKKVIYSKYVQTGTEGLPKWSNIEDTILHKSVKK